MTTDTTTNARDEDILVATIARSRATELRASLRTFKGKRFADLRIWTAGEGDTAHPTAKGVTLSPSLLPQLKKAVEDLLDEALKRAWIE